MRFESGCLALITGAAGDIGRAVARRLSSEGVSVVLNDVEHHRAALDELADSCRGGGAPQTVVSPFDVTDAEAVEAAFAAIVDTVGAPNLLFNNAGLQGPFTAVHRYDPADAASIFDVNISGVFTVLHVFAKTAVERERSGAVVNSASMAGVSGAPNMSAYSASKAAVIGLTKATAKDLAPHGIRVNAVSPGFIGPGRMWDTQVDAQAAAGSQYYSDDAQTVASEMINQIPLRRTGSVDEVASTVSFLLSNDASYVNGVNIEISGAAA